MRLGSAGPRLRRARLRRGRQGAALRLVVAILIAWSSFVEGQVSPVTVFEGARLITGDGSPPIENSAFIVENSRFTRVGRRGEVPIPAGAVRVDLTGKT